MTEEEGPPNASRSGQKSKRKKFFGKKRPKLELAFDSDDRKSFLTGFQKRKAERKLKAKHILDEELREEKLRQKQRQKDRLKTLYESQRPVPDMQHLLPSEATHTYELPKQMVSITTFDAKELSSSLGLSLGHNQQPVTTDDQSSDDENNKGSGGSGDDSDGAGGEGLQQRILNARKANKKESAKSLKTNKAFQMREQMKHKKDLSKSKLQRKLRRKEMKNMKQKTILKRQLKNRKNNKNKRKSSRNKHKKS
ncbi:unnamed protein product [Oppiella nova]|uniref:Nucleolar protein 12 n=1 Tax=Oppiella nova TaxID=334625 RepID=A0A7R9QDY2_9ACAR|nr:unnamed protein product [Oppiella nova]CAG2163405.1 unnamed protein product [Oppiella nova]